MSATASLNAFSCANGLSFSIWLKSQRHSEPIYLSNNAANCGFATANQRRGVIPFVTLVKRSGKMRAKSAKVEVTIKSEWISATPLILCEPTTDSQPIRTLRW